MTEFATGSAGEHATPALTRRRFLLTVAASGALAACSGSDGGDVGESAAGGAPPDGFTLVQRFPNNVHVPGVVRLPITLSTGAAQFIQDGPAELAAQVVDIDGAPIGDRLAAGKRDVAPAPYYDFRTTIEAPGVYALVVDGGPPTGAAFQVLVPEDVAVPTPGQLLPGFDTPTTGDTQGFDTICTRTPEPCPFHSLTLADALNVDRAVVYYVGTPAFCSTGSCAPALDALIGASERFGDTFVYVHAEVFSDDAGREIAPAVTAIGMTYEPALFITDAAGVIQERLDAVWDQTELEEALARVAG
ncbi:MAG: hypothetical protein HKN44_07120 [Ilumatobacter sp.]|nr:hypothetical protein [Ilumatobacter sp.]